MPSLTNNHGNGVRLKARCGMTARDPEAAFGGTTQDGLSIFILLVRLKARWRQAEQRHKIDPFTKSKSRAIESTLPIKKLRKSLHFYYSRAVESTLPMNSAEPSKKGIAIRYFHDVRLKARCR